MALYNEYFHHELTRKYTIAMGSLLNNIKVRRHNTAGDELHTDKVPLTFSAKEKFVQRLVSDGQLDTQVAVKLPRIAFNMTGMSYAPERKTQGRIRIKCDDEAGNTRTYVYPPVPYDLFFSVYIVAKTKTEMHQIIEQIVPFFTPYYSLTLKGIESPQINYEIPMSLVAVNPDDSFDGMFDDRRIVSAQLEFTMNAYYFGPARSGGVVDTVNIELYDDCDAEEPVSTITVDGL